MNYSTANQRQYLNQLTQLLVVVGALIVERVVGLPILFLGMTIQSVELTDRKTRRFVLVFASILLALFYQASFLTTFLLLGMGELVWMGLSTVSSSKTARVLASVATMLAVFMLQQQLLLNGKTVAYGVISVAILTASIRTNQKFTMRV
jgi:hypothetical protein